MDSTKREELPPMLLPVPYAAKLLGISRPAAYRLAETNELPVRRLGGRIYVVTARLLDLVGGGGGVKGHVYRRNNTFTYVFDGPPDPLTGERKQITKGGWKTEKEAWKRCRAAIGRLEEGRHVNPSRRTLGEYLLDEWLPAIKDSTAATTWGTGRSMSSRTSSRPWAPSGCRS